MDMISVPNKSGVNSETTAITHTSTKYIILGRCKYTWADYLGM
jgi:hypothetical protein